MGVKSRYSFELRKRYAEASGLKGGWLRNSGDGRYDDDEQFTEWRERRERVLSAKAPVERQRVPYHVAAQAVSSVAAVAGSDVAAYIEGLTDIDEEVRERLREKFVTSRETQMCDTS